MLMRLTAAAIVQNDDSQFLLIEERAQGTVVLNSPSGRWEVGESLAETAAREAAEEAGVLFVPEFLLGSYVTLHTAISGQRVCTVRFAFGGRIVSGVPADARDPAILGPLAVVRADHRKPIASSKFRRDAMHRGP